MIAEIYLYTNRNCIVFDEKGEQIVDLQKVLGVDSLEYWNLTKVEKALEEVILARPVIYIAKWNEWRKVINLDEFCCLLGRGQWYWEYKLNLKEEANEIL
jgi:hypothetical protein